MRLTHISLRLLVVFGTLIDDQTMTMTLDTQAWSWSVGKIVCQASVCIRLVSSWKAGGYLVLALDGRPRIRWRTD